MSVRQVLLVAVSALAFSLTSTAYPPAPVRAPAPNGLPVGRWTVQFANGVVEECEIRKDGPAGVAEPLRIAGGRAKADGAAVAIVFDDDRVERWTTVGQKAVVEHWYPAAQYPQGTPVLGIAERVR